MKQLLILNLIIYLTLYSQVYAIGSVVTYVREPEIEVYEVFEAEVTAYSELDSCHYENCITASGVRAYIGGIACPRWVELGTHVTIKGKEYTCEDRTAKKYNGRYDIFMGYGKESHEKALNFGRQTLEVRIK